MVTPVVLISYAPKEPPAAQHRAPAEKVTLTLAKVSVKRFEKEVLFICDVVIDNRTGAELTVMSNFHSAFDGLELVVLDETGRKLAQQSYLQRQSIYSLEPRKFPLKVGENRRELRFPVSRLPEPRKEYRVQLLGRLLQSDFGGILCSDLVTARVK
jgi:hypothetical protein